MQIFCKIDNMVSPNVFVVLVKENRNKVFRKILGARKLHKLLGYFYPLTVGIWQSRTIVVNFDHHHHPHPRHQIKPSDNPSAVMFQKLAPPFLQICFFCCVEHAFLGKSHAQVWHKGVSSRISFVVPQKQSRRCEFLNHYRTGVIGWFTWCVWWQSKFTIIVLLAHLGCICFPVLLQVPYAHHSGTASMYQP